MLRASLPLRCLLAWLAVSLAGAAGAQGFPSRALTLIVPWPAGGAGDFVARTLVKELEPLLAQSVIVDNVPGAGGSLGVAKALRAAADGHTLILSSPVDVILAPLSFPAAGFTAHDVRPVALLGRTDLMLVTRPGLGARTVADLVAMLKSKPDKPLSYCSSTGGSASELVFHRITALAGVKLLQVPYSGMPDCLRNLAGEQVDLASLPIAGPFPAMVEQGRVTAIAALGSSRHHRLPELPLAIETPGFDGSSISLWAGVHVHARVPEATVQRLHQALMAASQSSGFRTAMATTGGTGYAPMSLEAVQRIYDDDVQRLHGVARAATAQKAP